MNSEIIELNNDELQSVNGGAWQLLMVVTATLYAATEIGRAVHDATCDEHD
ncbi:MAG: class IIb bacteriocin, lactobin A/cerein 7B family [Pseudomonadota bacterium]|nr:class IIb bacteriocin, lactobin A/cerein 7B family [Pseudomonadota bacterium]